MAERVAKAVIEFSGDDSKLHATMERVKREARTAGREFSNLGSALDSALGTKLEQRANAAATSIKMIGGAAKLTDSEVKQSLALLNQWIEKAGKLGKNVSPHILQTRDALAQANKEGQKTPSIFDTISSKSLALGAAMTGAIGGLAWSAVNKLTSEIGTFVAQGQQLPAVEGSFRRLSSKIQQDSSAMLASMQRGTRGMVSEFDLMQQANKAMLLGLPVTSESMGVMSEAATKLGKAMGLGPTKSLDDLITALGRSSPMILDNLGLTVKVGEANEAYARKLGKASSELTEAEKKMAFYEAAMEAARKKTEELGDQTMTLGDIASAAWTKVADTVSKSVAIMDSQIGKILTRKDSLIEFLKLMAVAGNPGQALAAMYARDQAEAEVGAGTHKPRGGRPRSMAAQAAEEKRALEALRQEAMSLNTQALTPLTAVQRELASEFLKGGKSAKEIADKLNGVKSTAGVTESQIQRLADQQKNAKKSGDDYAQALKTIKDAEIPLTAAQRDRVGELLKLGHSHGTIATALRVSEVAVKNFDESQKAAAKSSSEWQKILLDLSKASITALAQIAAAQDKARKAGLKAFETDLLAELKAKKEFEEKNLQLTLSGTALRLRQIDVEYKARLDALNEHHDAETESYRQAKAQIDAYYAHLRGVASGTYDTIVARMRAAGVLTRSDLVQTARDAVRDYEQMKASGEFTADAVREAFLRMNDALRAAGLQMKNDWTGAFDEILDAMTRFAGGMVSTIAAAIQQVRQAIATLRDGTLNTSQRVAGAGLGALSTWNATGQEGQSTAQSTISGMAQGAAAGAYFGPAGMIAGTVIGGVVGYFRGRAANNEHKKVNDARDEFLGQFGGAGTGPGSGFHEIARQLHTLGPLGDELFDRVANARTMAEFEAATRAANEALDGMRAELSQIAQNGGVASQSLIRFRDAMRDTAEVQQFIRSETQTAGQSFTAFLQAGAAAYQKLAELKKKHAEASGEERDKLAQEIAKQQQIVGGTGITSQAQATGMGAALFGTFSQMRDLGMPIREALAQLQPAIEAFKVQLDATGLSGGAAFERIAHLAGIATSEIGGPALDAIGNLTRGLEAAHNAGFLNQEMFTGLVGKIMDSRQALIDQGHTAEDVNGLMQRELQSLWVLTKDHGYEVDENTQKLLDEAEAAGLVGDKYRSALDRAALAMERAADTIERAFGRAGGAADDFGKKVDHATRPRTMKVGIEADDLPDFEPGSGSPAPAVPPTSYPFKGGLVERWGVRYLSTGGLLSSIFKPRGTDTIPAMLTPGEGVLNTRAMNIVGAGALSDLNAGRIPDTFPPRPQAPVSVREGDTVIHATVHNAQNMSAKDVAIEVAKQIRRGGEVAERWLRDVKPVLVPRTV